MLLNPRSLDESNGFYYYAYVLIYVDDVMVIHHEAESVLRQIYNYFKLMTSSIGNCDIIWELS